MSTAEQEWRAGTAIGLVAAYPVGCEPTGRALARDAACGHTVSISPDTDAALARNPGLERRCTSCLHEDALDELIPTPEQHAEHRATLAALGLPGADDLAAEHAARLPDRVRAARRARP